MSIKLMSKAFTVQLPASQKLVLIAMCDYANDEGLSCYPSVAQVAIKASLSVRQCKRVLGGLVSSGYIDVIANQHGGPPGATRHYKINIKKLETGDTHGTGDILSRVTPVVETGDTSGKRRVTPMAPNPSVNHHETPKKEARPSDTQPDPPPPKSKKPKAVFNPALIDLPGWLDPDLWRDWCEDRKARRKPVTEKAAPLQIKKLAKYMEQGFLPQDVIENSIANGYQGLFPPNKDRGQNDGQHKSAYQQDVDERIARTFGSKRSDWAYD